MLRKIKFYLIGLIPGLILVGFILNQKGASCSGYLPNSRVIAETLSKKFTYSNEVNQQMKLLNIDEKYLKDSIISEGEIDFDNSEAQRQPCPRYVLISNQSEVKKYKVHFEKCKEEVKIERIEMN